MAKISTDLKQSKKLIELGLNPKTADMYWEASDPDGSHYTLGAGEHLAITNNLFSFREGLVVPAWSLSALLDIMPQHIDQSVGWQKFGLDKGWDGGIYQVYYENQNSFVEQKAGEAVDAAYEMVCWLLEKGFIKKED